MADDLGKTAIAFAIRETYAATCALRRVEQLGLGDYDVERTVTESLDFLCEEWWRVSGMTYLDGDRATAVRQAQEWCLNNVGEVHALFDSTPI